MVDLKTRVGKVTFENPIWVASGTFGYGKEMGEFIDLNKLGAVVTKTVTLRPRQGNPTPRVVETPAGLLNSIGLENKGIVEQKKEIFSFLKKYRTRIVFSVGGGKKEEFTACVEELTGKYKPDAIELNLSCPNVSHKAGKYRLFAQDPVLTKNITAAVRKLTKTMLIVKLTPNVTDIGVIAKAAESGGADAVALVNTYLGMAVDPDTMKPVLGNVAGGLSGPAIKPLALKAVWDTYQKVKIPIIGIGGIMSGKDVAEFMLCGASAVQVGTANLADPVASERILKEFKQYLKKHKIKNSKDLVGRLNT
jgi:dihydroorotate dehydrogenase (NAD+) catalytic subunit